MRGFTRFLDTVAPHLALSASERARQIPVRVFLAVLMGAALHQVGLNVWLTYWAIAFVAVQGFEIWSMSPFRGGGEVGRFRVGCAVASTMLMALLHAGVALVIWTVGDAVPATLAVMVLAGGLLTNVASGIGSRPMFLIGGGPYLAAVALMPVIKGLDGDFADVALMAGCGALFVGAILNVYGRVYAARRAELDARTSAEERLEQAQAAMADRAAMAAIVSHELRTPVSAILAGAHVIRQGDAPESVPDTADLIIDAGRLMTGMLNDLLDHSKMEAGAMQVEQRDFDLNAFIHDAAQFWAAPAHEKGLSLVSVSADEDVWLKGDPFRLRQIVNNLVSNAIKFTAQGEVRLEVSVSCGQDGQRRLRLAVTDQGRGIPPEAMQRLFSPFAQGSAEVARTYGGTGLGLTVSRDLARAMGGDLTAVSEEGRGATFNLTLDLPEGQPVDDAGEDLMAPTPERRLRILAVDDHEINRRTLALVLQPLDVDLSMASDGHLALELLAAQPFDVVLMDVNMPGIDGMETTRRLRASSGRNAAVPVIGFSAATEPAHVQACSAAGMTDWLAKPLEPKKLYEALHRASRTASEAAAA